MDIRFSVNWFTPVDHTKYTTVCLCNYVFHIWTKHLAQLVRSHKSAVFSIIKLHHGQSRWNGSCRELAELCRILRNMRTTNVDVCCIFGNWLWCVILQYIRNGFLTAPECSRVSLVCQLWAVWNASLPADESRLLKKCRSPAQGRNELNVWMRFVPVWESVLVIGVYVLALNSGTDLEHLLFSFVVDESLPVSSSRD